MSTRHKIILKVLLIFFAIAANLSHAGASEKPEIFVQMEHHFVVVYK